MIRRSDRKRARWRGLALAAGSALLTATLAFGLSVAVLIGRPIDAPGWLEDRIVARLAQALPGLAPSIGGLALRLGVEGRGHVVLRDVTVSDADGTRLLGFAEAEIALSTGGLLRGALQLRGVRVSGAALTVRRTEAGRVGVALGGALPQGALPPIPEVIARIDAALDDPRLALLLRVEADDVTLFYEDLRADRRWTASGARLRLTRSGGRLDLFADLSAPADERRRARIELSAQSDIGSRALRFGIALDDLPARDIASQSPALAWLDALDAPISGALRAGLDPDGALGPLNATLSIGAGALAPAPQTRPIPFQQARAYFTYDPVEDALDFDEIAVVSPLGRARAEGEIRLDRDGAGWPRALWGQLRLEGLALEPGAVSDRAYTVQNARASIRLALDPFRIRLGSFEVLDAALPISATGRAAAGAEGWDLALDVRAARSDPAQVLAFWPEAVAPRPRDWVRRSVERGTVRDVALALRATGGAPAVAHLDFAFSDTQVRINHRLPPVTGAAGQVTIAGSRLSVRLDEGRMIPDAGGPIDLAGTEFVIPDLRRQPARGETRLSAESSITAALAFLDNDAWRLLRRVGRSPQVASGQVRVEGTIDRSLARGVPFEDVALDLSAVLRGVTSDRLVEGRALRADRLDLAATGAGLTLSGPITLDGLPARMTWDQDFRGGGGTVTAALPLGPALLEAFGVRLPDGLARGEADARLTLDLVADRAPAFRLESDVAGLALTLPALGWSKPSGVPGRLVATGRAGAAPGLDTLDLAAPGLTLAARPELGAGGIEALTLDRIAVRGWLDASGRIELGPGGAIDLAGGMLDLRGLPQGGAGGDGSGSDDPGARAPVRPLNLALDSLRINRDVALTGFEGDFALGRGIAGRFDAGVNGAEARVSGRVTPGDDGRTQILVEARDAGATLAATGLVDTLRGGRMRLTLSAVPGTPGRFDGELAIRDTLLREAPGFAALLDAVSIVGLIDELEGAGIRFGDIDARFRIGPDRIVLQQASAVGPSMGVSLDGYVDPRNGEMDLQGVLSPFYILNAVGRVMARQGEGLVGFTFTLRGTRDDPRVGVNPLSAFTPGLFRDIFRRPPPVLSD